MKPKITRTTIGNLSFSSMESMSGQTGIPKSILQFSKKNGCQAFETNGRVILQPFLKWFFTQGIASNSTDWGKLNTELDAKLKQVKLDSEMRKLVSKVEVEELLREFSGICFGALKRHKLESPRDYEQRSRAFIKLAEDKKFDRICEQVRAKLREFGEIEVKIEGEDGE